MITLDIIGDSGSPGDPEKAVRVEEDMQGDIRGHGVRSCEQGGKRRRLIVEKKKRNHSGPSKRNKYSCRGKLKGNGGRREFGGVQLVKV